MDRVTQFEKKKKQERQSEPNKKGVDPGVRGGVWGTVKGLGPI